jgi:hypothetical protein
VKVEEVVVARTGGEPLGMPLKETLPPRLSCTEAEAPTESAKLGMLPDTEAAAIMSTVMSTVTGMPAAAKLMVGTVTLGIPGIGVAVHSAEDPVQSEGKPAAAVMAPPRRSRLKPAAPWKATLE